MNIPPFPAETRAFTNWLLTKRFYFTISIEAHTMLNVWALINSDKTLPRHKKSPKPHRFGRCLSYKWRRRCVLSRSDSKKLCLLYCICYHKIFKFTIDFFNSTNPTRIIKQQISSTILIFFLFRYYLLNFPSLIDRIKPL